MRKINLLILPLLLAAEVVAALAQKTADELADLLR